MKVYESGLKSLGVGQLILKKAIASQFDTLCERGSLDARSVICCSGFVCYVLGPNS